MKKNKIVYLCIGLGVLVVALLITVAFLLGQRFGEKNRTPAASDPAPTEQGTADAAPSALPTEEAVRPTEKPEPAETTGAADDTGERRSMIISMSAGDLTFSGGSEFGVEYDERVISVEDSGDTIAIENRYSDPSASQRRKMNVTVTIPPEYVFDRVDIELGAGKLLIRTLTAETFSLQFGAGSATVNDITVTGSAEIQEGAGALSVSSGTLANLTLQCGAGATHLDAALTGDSRINAGFGALDANLTGSEADYTVAFDVDFGVCFYNGDKIARSGSYGEGPNRVNITGGLGIMHINVG